MWQSQREPIIVPYGSSSSSSSSSLLYSNSRSSLSILSSQDDDESREPSSLNLLLSEEPKLSQLPVVPTNSPCASLSSRNIHEASSSPEKHDTDETFISGSAVRSQYLKGTCSFSSCRLLASRGSQMICPLKIQLGSTIRHRPHSKTGVKRKKYCQDLDVRQINIQGSGLMSRPYSSSLLERHRIPSFTFQRPSSSKAQRPFSSTSHRLSTLPVQRLFSALCEQSVLTSPPAQSPEKKCFEEINDGTPKHVSHSMIQTRKPIKTRVRRSQSSSRCNTALGLRPLKLDVRPSKSSISQLEICGSTPTIQSLKRETSIQIPGQTDQVLDPNTVIITDETEDNNSLSEYEHSLDFSSRGRFEKDLIYYCSDVCLHNTETPISNCDYASSLRSSPISSPYYNSSKYQHGTIGACSNALSTQVIRRGKSTWEPFWETCPACYKSVLEKTDDDGLCSSGVKNDRIIHTRDPIIPPRSSSCQPSTFQAVLVGKPVRKANLDVLPGKLTTKESLVCLSPKPQYNTERSVSLHGFSENQKSSVNDGPQSSPQKTVSEMKCRNQVANMVISTSTVFRDYRKMGNEENELPAVGKPCHHQNYMRTRENLDELKYISPAYTSLPRSPSRVSIRSDSLPKSKVSSSNLLSPNCIQPTKITIPDDFVNGFEDHCSLKRLQVGRIRSCEDPRTAPQTSVSYCTNSASKQQRCTERKTIISSAVIQESLKVHSLIQRPVAEHPDSKTTNLIKRMNLLSNRTFGKSSFGKLAKQHQPTGASLPYEYLRQRYHSVVGQKFEDNMCFPDTQKQTYNPSSKISRLTLCHGKNISNSSDRTSSETAVKQEHSFDPCCADSGTKLISHLSTIHLPPNERLKESHASVSVKRKEKHGVLKQRKPRVHDDKEKSAKRSVTEDTEISTDKVKHPECTSPTTSPAGHQSKTAVTMDKKPYALVVKGIRKYFSAKTLESKKHSMTMIPTPPATDKPQLSKPAQVNSVCLSLSDNSDSCSKRARGVEPLSHSENKTLPFTDKGDRDSPKTNDSAEAFQRADSSDNAATKFSEKPWRSQFVGHAGAEEGMISMNLKAETHCMTMNYADDKIRRYLHLKSMKTTAENTKDDMHDKSTKNVNNVRNIMKNIDCTVSNNGPNKSMKNADYSIRNDVILLNEGGGIPTKDAKSGNSVNVQKSNNADEGQNDAVVEIKLNSIKGNIKYVSYGDDETLSSIPDLKDTIRENEHIVKVPNKKTETSEKQSTKEQSVKTVFKEDQNDTKEDSQTTDTDKAEKPDTEDIRFADIEDNSETDTEGKPAIKDQSDSDTDDKPYTNTEVKQATDTEDEQDTKTVDYNICYKSVVQRPVSAGSTTRDTSSASWGEDEESSEEETSEDMGEENEEDEEKSKDKKEEKEECQEDNEEGNGEENEGVGEDGKPGDMRQTVESIKPLSTAMMKEYCRQLKKRGGEYVTLSKTVSGWHYDYDQFSRVNHPLRHSRF